MSLQVCTLDHGHRQYSPQCAIYLVVFKVDSLCSGCIITTAGDNNFPETGDRTTV